MHKTLICAAVVSMLASSAMAQSPAFYPKDYDKTIEAAKSEGKVVLYSPLSTTDIQPLITDFQTLYPGVTVEAVDLNTNVLYNRFISEVAADSASADVVWSSASDLQAKLVDDGYAEAYKSPEEANLPKWAVWDKGGFGTTFEPFLSIFNKSHVTTPPESHAAIAKLISEDQQFVGKVATYNIETSGVGFYGISRDSEQGDKFQGLAEALGKVKVRFYSSNGEMIESVASGENLFAYNLPGFFAQRATKNPSIGVIYPKDFLTIGTRVAFLSAKAQHPNAGRLFLDYLLSQRGQQVIANLGFFSLRDDVDGEAGAKALRARFGDALVEPEVGPELLKYLDPAKRTEFLGSWKKNTQGTN
ncbi:ABC transporter substrate-binding protein [Ensifer sp. SSB1]|uniref:ABC transporter substrate-binding protein n=1 Tax=Ensifer sp. SSB1 TaxID=2795385 RepID=UPI001A3F5E56|nr:ABC transporter substrate-binding protein [Ensifer sp. SSB1]MBK5567883.1 ABC transporter substrate-binding protein [Ensifer sp. SSB1]